MAQAGTDLDTICQWSSTGRLNNEAQSLVRQYVVLAAVRKLGAVEPEGAVNPEQVRLGVSCFS